MGFEALIHLIAIVEDAGTRADRRMSMCLVWRLTGVPKGVRGSVAGCGGRLVFPERRPLRADPLNRPGLDSLSMSLCQGAVVER